MENEAMLKKNRPSEFDWRPLFSNLPLVMLAVPASYGVASFESGVYPAPVNWFMAAAFESVYLGAIFLAQDKSKGMFAITISIAVVCGIIYNLLHAANIDGLLAHSDLLMRWLLAAIHGAPLSLISLCYALLLHKTSDEKSEQSVATGPVPTITLDYFEAELARRDQEAKAAFAEQARKNELEAQRREQEWQRRVDGLLESRIILDGEKLQQMVADQVRGLLPERGGTDGGEGETEQVVVPAKSILDVVKDALREPGTVRDILSELGINLEVASNLRTTNATTMSVPDKNLARQYRAEGRSLGWIATTMSVPKSTVTGWVKDVAVVAATSSGNGEKANRTE